MNPKFFSKQMLIRVSYMLSIWIMGKGYGVLNTYRGEAHILEHPLDRLIPFNKYFVVPYFFWYYPLLIVLGSYLAYKNYPVYKRFVLAVNIGMVTSFMIYLIYPTTVPRPYVEGTDFFSSMVLMIYAKDNPYNCFPSIHVLKSLLMGFYAVMDHNLGKVLKYIICFANFIIILSTVYMKQHYVYDILGGLAVALLSYKLANHMESAGYLSLGYLRQLFTRLVFPKGLKSRAQNN